MKVKLSRCRDVSGLWKVLVSACWSVDSPDHMVYTWAGRYVLLN